MVWRYQQLPTTKPNHSLQPQLLSSEEHLIPIGDGTPGDGDVTHLHGAPGVRAMASSPGEHWLLQGVRRVYKSRPTELKRLPNISFLSRRLSNFIYNTNCLHFFLTRRIAVNFKTGKLTRWLKFDQDQQTIFLDLQKIRKTWVYYR